LGLQTQTRKHGDAMLVQLTGELDHHTADHVRQSVDSELERGNVKHVMMDFSELDFMDSSGLGMLLGRYKRVTQLGGSMAVCGVGGTLIKLFELSGLFKIIRQYDSFDAFVSEMEER